MNEENLLLQLVNSSYTKADIKRRLRLLREYLEMCFYTPDANTPLTEFLKKKYASVEDMKIIGSWGKDFLGTFNKANLYTTLNKLIEDIDKLPVICLYLPYEPGKEDKEKFGNILREKFGKSLIMDVKRDEKIFAGCALVKNGVYHDYSLRAYLERHKDKIEGVVDKYLEKNSKCKGQKHVTK